MPDDPDSSDAVEEDRIEAEALREAEQLTPRRAALEKLVEKYPPPREWHDEPGWTDPPPEPRKPEEQIARNSYVVHIVPDDLSSPTGFSACTFGVRDAYGHPDFQLVAPLPPGTACEVLGNLVEAVKAGRRFAAGETAAGIIHDHVVGFAAATEGGREVLRVIMPDREGRTARGEIGGEFARQYEGTS